MEYEYATIRASTFSTPAGRLPPGTLARAAIGECGGSGVPAANRCPPKVGCEGDTGGDEPSMWNGEDAGVEDEWPGPRQGYFCTPMISIAGAGREASVTRSM